MSIKVIDQFSNSLNGFPASVPKAHTLQADERKKLGLEMVVRRQSVVDLAAEYEVSRKFLYTQQSRVEKAMHNEFECKAEHDKVLFHLPITEDWLKQFVITQVLVCHCSFRGVIEVLRDLFDTKMSIGTVYNIIRSACSLAEEYQKQEDLSQVKVGLHDEIFQAGKPVLAGIEADSTYCYLLSKEDHRDETTWGVHLLDLQNKGLNPEHTIADGGNGLRAGQKAAWPSIPCHGDVFHAERELGKLKTYLENQAYGAIAYCEKMEKKAAKACKNKQGQKFSKKLALARQRAGAIIKLFDLVTILSDWIKDDILSLGGDDYDTRVELYDYVVNELRCLEPQCSYRIKPVRRLLENQKTDLLAFAMVLEEKLNHIASSFGVDVWFVQEICKLLGTKRNTGNYWQKNAKLQQRFGVNFYEVTQQVLKAMKETPRASSLVENLNSRLRNYFFLRRHIGSEYLGLLRFFLNHRCFMRSERPEREGKSPAEVLSGQPHPHWLEIMGFELFKRQAA
jgi:hypothetical protein